MRFLFSLVCFVVFAVVSGVRFEELMQDGFGTFLAGFWYVGILRCRSFESHLISLIFFCVYLLYLLGILAQGIAPISNRSYSNTVFFAMVSFVVSFRGGGEM